MKPHNPFSELSRFEILLWTLSMLVVSLGFFLGNPTQPLTLIASLVGVTALIFVAKGFVLGQILTVVFSLLYAVVSLRERYYGEMITYLGMSAPIALMSVISWIRHPYEQGKSEVEVASLGRQKVCAIMLCSILATILFYFILAYFNTASLLVSTLSITTSFLASALMFFRSPYYALAYAANDIVLIILWIISTIHDLSCLPMVLCFVMFFLNDLYGYYSWRRMKHRQQEKKTAA